MAVWKIWNEKICRKFKKNLTGLGSAWGLDGLDGLDGLAVWLRTGEGYVCSSSSSSYFSQRIFIRARGQAYKLLISAEFTCPGSRIEAAMNSSRICNRLSRLASEPSTIFFIASFCSCSRKSFKLKEKPNYSCGLKIRENFVNTFVKCLPSILDPSLWFINVH